MKHIKIKIILSLIFTHQNIVDATIQKNVTSKANKFSLDKKPTFKKCEELRQIFINHLNQSGKDLSDEEYKLFSKCGKENKIHLRDNDHRNQKPLDHQSLLHQAVKHNKKNGIVCLLEAGIDIEVEDKEKNTPLYYAQNSEIINFLAQKGASINHKNIDGMTPFNYCMTHDPNPNKIKAFIDLGIDVKEVDNNGKNGIQNALGKNLVGKEESILLVMDLYTHLSDFSKKERQQIKTILAQPQIPNMQKEFLALAGALGFVVALELLRIHFSI